MFTFSKLFGRATKSNDLTSAASARDPPPSTIVVNDSAFSLHQHIAYREGYPILDWQAVQHWVGSLPSDDLQSYAWLEAERAWLLHMGAALGENVRLNESNKAMLLSTLEPSVARSTLNYMERALQRVVRLLDGIALVSPLGKDLLLVFDHDESYYQYVSCYYPDAGEFALSGGMHIDAGCSHYVTVKSDLSAIEPIIAHEMTHGCLGHLALPAWLNEGLAVNVEQQLVPGRSAYTPQQLQSKQLAFWGEKEIQEFWSGKSFLRTDDGNLLSYELARLIVEQMSRDWTPFKQFVLAANDADAGASAAREHLNADLGEFVCALLEKAPASAWAPDPSTWDGAPERGRFAKFAVLR